MQFVDFHDVNFIKYFVSAEIQLLLRFNRWQKKSRIQFFFMLSINFPTPLGDKYIEKIKVFHLIQNFTLSLHVYKNCVNM